MRYSLSAALAFAARLMLFRLVEGRTVMVIAHRLSTIQRADSIACLKDGRLVEQGTHRELLRLEGEYARLVDSQALTLRA